MTWMEGQIVRVKKETCLGEYTEILPVLQSGHTSGADMEPSTPSPTLVRFGNFELDTRAGELSAENGKIRLQEQPLRILMMLIERRGGLVTREELHNALWPGSPFGDVEDGLNHAVRRLRAALGDDVEMPRYIQTVPRRGYRLIAPVETARRAVSENETFQRNVSTSVRAPLRRRLPLFLAGTLAVAVVGFAVAWFATHRAAPPASPLTERRLTANPSENAVTSGSISPDGKYVAYGDRMGMHLKLIHTGETVNIPQPPGPAMDPGSWWPNGWFPGGTRFVATGVEPGGRVSAWVISALGGPPRKLRDDAEPWFVSPDGTLITFGTGEAFVRYREAWVMGAEGEEPRKLVGGSEDDAFFNGVWSPDGQRVAYFRFHRTPEKLECSIESRDLKGSAPTVLLSDPRLYNGTGLGTIWWFPDSRIIYSMSEPGSEAQGQVLDNNLWEIRVDTRTGQAVNKPRRITNWAGVTQALTGGTKDGKQLAGPRWTVQADVYVGELEGGGRRLKNTHRLTLNENFDYPGGWMPDSKTVLFSSNRNGTWDIFKQALDQVEAQPVATGPDLKSSPVASPDGSWILYLSSAAAQVGPATPVRIMRVPASGGAPHLVLEGRGMDGLACARSPATLCVSSERTPDDGHLIFSAFDPVNGKGKEFARINLRQPPKFYGWDLSRDGSRLAFAQYNEREGRIQILPLSGAKPWEVNVKGWNELGPLSWAADGRGLLVSRLQTSGSMLLYVDLEGHAVVLWQQRLAGSWGAWGVPSPDGRYLAVLGYTVSGNVWLLENF